MSTNKNNNSKGNKKVEASRRSRAFYKTPAFLIICLFIIIGCSVFTGIYLSKKSSDKQKSDTSSVQSQTSEKSSSSSSSEKPDKVSGSTPDGNDESDGKTPVQYDGENPNNSDSLTGNITYAGFSGGKFLIRVSIDQYLSSGTCTLNISDGNNSYEAVANIFPEASTSSCEGFDVPSAELKEFANNIEILINLSSGEKTGTIEGVTTL